MRNWFEHLTGFREVTPDQVRSNILLNGEHMISLVNHRQLRHGRLQVASLADIKRSCLPTDHYDGKLSLSEMVADVQQLHIDPANQGAMFQAASQFNLLEMTGPSVTPEEGVGIYEYDRTQGPACAIACGAGTIFRNYFAAVNDRIGQTSDHQIDCLDEIGKALNNQNSGLWTMQNGYALAGKDGLIRISEHLRGLSSEGYEELKGKLKIGLQWNTEVTISSNGQEVSQAYCSALPVAYSTVEQHYWKDFAILILEATYEATFYAALRNYEETGNNKLFLTLVGGGAFGNKMSWILHAIEKAAIKFKNTPIEISIVSYRRSHPLVKQMVESLPK
jgi:hypothetical protein